MKPVKIAGRLVALRELEEGDAEALHEVYGDPEVCRFMSFTPRTFEQCEAIIAAARAEAEAEPRRVYMLAITDPAGKLIGAARLALEEWSAAQFGMALNAGHWGRGEGTEAARLLFHLGFHELHVHRIWGARSPRNEVSRRLMATVGMTGQGIIRSHVPRHGVWEDSETASIVEDEYVE